MTLERILEVAKPKDSQVPLVAPVKTSTDCSQPSIAVTIYQSMSQQNTPVSTIRYRFGMAPDRELVSDPSFSQIISELNASDGAVFAASVLIPTLYGFRLRRTLLQMRQKIA